MFVFHIAAEAVCVKRVHGSTSVFTDRCYEGLYPGHIHTTALQKTLLAVGSGVAALHDPYRHGETCSRFFSIVTYNSPV